MKLKTISLYALACIVLVGLTGCIRKTKRTRLEAIALGTTKEVVIKELGEPLSVSSIKKTNKNIDVFQYATHTSKNKFKRGLTIAAHTILSICTLGIWIPIAIATESINYAPYFLHFTNNELTRSTTIEINV